MSGQRTRLKIRRPETITPYGVGAIFDAGGESFVAADTRQWHTNDLIVEERLQKALGVATFKASPPAAKQGSIGRSANGSSQQPGVPFVRFPRWLYCPRCRHMNYWTDEHDPIPGEPPRCQHCRQARRLIPMPYVMVCARGHLSDVPWWTLVHPESKRPCTETNPILAFRTASGSSPFSRVECSCGALRSLAGITSAETLREIGIRCRDSQPWLPSNADPGCGASPVIVQRNGRNVHYSVYTSTIDIPPYSDYDPDRVDCQKVLNSPPYRDLIARENPSPAYYNAMRGRIANDVNLPPPRIDYIVKLLADRQAEAARLAALEPLSSSESDAGPEPDNNPSTDETPKPRPTLLADEYRQLLAPDRYTHPDSTFHKRIVPLTTPFSPGAPEGDPAYAELTAHLRGLLGHLVQVTRLREVRALQGFTRLRPPSNTVEGDAASTTVVPPSLLPNPDWLPAVETFGEGIFISLNEARVQDWESRPAVVARCARLDRRAGDSWLPGLGSQPVSPRLVMLHTLAHLLLRRLSFTAGYPLPALRERIYALPPGTGADPMAGILIYTTAGDAQGTLGGLVREGEADRFLSTLLQALQQVDWCSSDPLCRESLGQGPDNLNLAACHACALVPETSCALWNRLLDRTLVLGSDTHRAAGYFGELMEQILDVMTLSR